MQFVLWTKPHFFQTASLTVQTVLQKIRNKNESKHDDVEPDLCTLVEFLTKDAVLWEVFQIKVRERNIVTSYALKEFLHNYVYENRESFLMMYNIRKEMEEEEKDLGASLRKQERTQSLGFFQSLLNNNNKSIRRLF